MCMQLTYEGLVDETLRIRYGTTQLPQAAGAGGSTRQRAKDQVFTCLHASCSQAIHRDYLNLFCQVRPGRMPLLPEMDLKFCKVQ